MCPYCRLSRHLNVSFCEMASAWSRDEHRDMLSKIWAHVFVCVIVIVFVQIYKQKHISMNCACATKHNLMHNFLLIGFKGIMLFALVSRSPFFVFSSNPFLYRLIYNCLSWKTSCILSYTDFGHMSVIITVTSICCLSIILPHLSFQDRNKIKIAHLLIFFIIIKSLIQSAGTYQLYNLLQTCINAKRNHIVTRKWQNE